jgi:hypothetical protein
MSNIVIPDERTPHPRADILLRIAGGEDLSERIWAYSESVGNWVQYRISAVLSTPERNYCISDKPNEPPPLPRKKLQLRKDGPWYYQGETVAPGDDVMVWVARSCCYFNELRWGLWDEEYRDRMFRLGLVHLSEANYRLHMVAQEDFLQWVHGGQS